MAKSSGSERAADPSTVFSWVHLSDVHVGSGSAGERWDQQGMLTEMVKDLRANVDRTVPSPDVILVTGDVAFSGGIRARAGERSSVEYATAAAWLSEVGQAIGVDRNDIFVIPGNHDIQRVAKSDRQAFRLIDSLRSGREQLDDALADPGDRRVLTSRLQNFLQFASPFAPIFLNPVTQPEQWLYWTHLDDRPTVAIRFIGLNTALLCNGEDDRGNLFVDLRQLDLIKANEPLEELRIVLMHHPPHGGWLGNEAAVRKALQGRANIVLSGHEHSADVRRSGTSSSDLIELAAGAVYESAGSSPDSYTYNVTAICRHGEGGLRLRIWPRRWSDKAQQFRADVGLLNDGETFSDIALPAIEPSSRVRRTSSVPPLPPLSGASNVSTAAWLVGPAEARSWLSALGLAGRRELLVRGRIRLEEVGKNGPVFSPVPDQNDDPWRVSVIEQLIEHAAQQKRTVVPIFLHGIRGIGVTTLLLRLIAAERSKSNVYLMVDCSSHGERSLDDARHALKTRLQLLIGRGGKQTVFVAVDGLDLACRAQAVRDGEPEARKVLTPEIHRFANLVKESADSARIVLLFSASDPPALNAGEDLVAEPGWASPVFMEFVRDEHGIAATLVPSVLDGDSDVWSLAASLPVSAIPRAPHDPRSFLILPLFFDALRDAGSGAQMETRRDVLSAAVARVRGLGARRHSYYRALDQLTHFIDTLAKIPLKKPAQPTDELRACVNAIAAEVTGEWLYLLPLNRSEHDVQARMRELRDWLALGTWRYSDTYALSNLVSAIAILGEKEPVGRQTYLHCNLRNAYMDGARISGVEFHGVDLSGAQLRKGHVSHARFYGANLVRARFTGTTVEQSRFVGCLFDSTLINEIKQRSVSIVEPLPAELRPAKRAKR